MSDSIFLVRILAAQTKEGVTQCFSAYFYNSRKSIYVSSICIPPLLLKSAPTHFVLLHTHTKALSNCPHQFVHLSTPLVLIFFIFLSLPHWMGSRLADSVHFSALQIRVEGWNVAEAMFSCQYPLHIQRDGFGF